MIFDGSPHASRLKTSVSRGVSFHAVRDRMLEPERLREFGQGGPRGRRLVEVEPLERCDKIPYAPALPPCRRGAASRPRFVRLWSSVVRINLRDSAGWIVGPVHPEIVVATRQNYVCRIVGHLVSSGT